MKIIGRPIEVISWTEKDGKIHPVKLRVEGKDSKRHIYNIEQVYKSECEKIAGNVMYKYTCEVCINDTKRLCEIKYERDTCRWILYKI